MQAPPLQHLKCLAAAPFTIAQTHPAHSAQTPCGRALRQILGHSPPAVHETPHCRTFHHFHGARGDEAGRDAGVHSAALLGQRVLHKLLSLLDTLRVTMRQNAACWVQGPTLRHFHKW